MTMRVCALLLPPRRDGEIALEITATLRARAIILKPEWQDLSDTEILEQVLRCVRDHQVRATINKQSTTTKVGSLTEET